MSAVRSVLETLFSDIRRFLPAYLSTEDKQQLFADLRRLQAGDEFACYWRNPDPSELLQGDIWRPFVIRRFDSGEARQVTGIVLSNSCDVDPSNDPDPNQGVVFAPVRSLAKFRESLLRRGKSERDADITVTNLKKQLGPTDTFYLPAHADLLPESFISFDDLHSHPLLDFMKRRQERLATLSQAGHYVFLLKISIHFTRLQEGVRRAGS